MEKSENPVILCVIHHRQNRLESNRFMRNDMHDLYFSANYFFSPLALEPNLGLGLPPWNSPFHFGLLDLRQSVGLLGRVISSSQCLYLYTNTEKRTCTQTPNMHVVSGIRTHDPSFQASEDSACLRTLGYRDRLWRIIRMNSRLTR
jgi:hypothetical protein